MKLISMRFIDIKSKLLYFLLYLSLFIYFIITNIFCTIEYKNRFNYPYYFNKPKISIFLTVYNKEDYLKNSIGSIQKQSLKEVEIITVNDNSKDNSLRILYEIAKLDKRVKIINNKKNMGTLYSRGIGILMCKGEYLMTLDSDDEYHLKNSFQFLYSTVKKFNIDMICFFYYNLLNKTKLYKFCEPNIIITQHDYMKYILKDPIITNKMIKKEIYHKIFESFKPEILSKKWIYHDDNIFSILAHKYANSSLLVNKVIYKYHRNKNSSMLNRGNIVELKNLYFRYEKFKQIFNSKHEKKILIEQDRFLLNYYKKYIKIMLKDKTFFRNYLKVLQNHK